MERMHFVVRKTFSFISSHWLNDCEWRIISIYILCNCSVCRSFSLYTVLVAAYSMCVNAIRRDCHHYPVSSSPSDGLRWKLKVLAFSWWCDSIYLKMMFKICNWNELSLELSAEAIYSLATFFSIRACARVSWRSSVCVHIQWSFRLHQYPKMENDENFGKIRIWIVKQTSWMRHRLGMITNKEEVKLFCRTEQWNRIE